MMNKVVYSFWLLAVLSPVLAISREVSRNWCSAMPSNQAFQEEGTGFQLGGGEDNFFMSNSLPENTVVLESPLEKLQKVILKNLEQAMASTAGLMMEVETLREENAMLKARMSRLEEQALDSGFAEEVASLEQRMDVVESTLNTHRGTPQMTDKTPETTQTTLTTTRYWHSTRAPQISDRRGLITYILATEQGKLLLADYNQQEVKVTNPDNINRLTDTLSLGMTPWSMTQLDDGTVVVTCENEPKMSFLRLNDYGLKMERTIDLDRRYRGVSQCGNGSLYASSRKNTDDYPQFDANINIINREGEVLQTVMSGADYEDLDKPFFLTCRGSHLYISDWTSHKVLMLNVHTHRVTTIFGEMDLAKIGMYQPRVVAFDQHENMYVATGGRACSRYSSDIWCIIQVSPNGQWKRLDEYHSGWGTQPYGVAWGRYPYGVAVTDTEIFISWGSWKHGTWYTYLTSYPLPQPLPEATTRMTTALPSTVPIDSIPWGKGDGENDDDEDFHYSGSFGIRF